MQRNRTVEKYIFKNEVNGTIGYVVFIHRKDLKIRKRFETLEKAQKYRDLMLRYCEQNREQELKETLGIKEFPYNMIKRLGWNEKEVIESFETRYENLAWLNDRERYILDEVFKNERLFVEIGKDLGITAARVGQIYQKAMRKVKCKEKWFKLGDYATPEKLAREEYEAYIEELKSKWTYESALKFIEEFEPKIDDRPLEWLDLSVRSFNCLKRQGIRTIGELLRFDEEHTQEEWQRVRNLGKKSYKEIQEAIKRTKASKEAGQ